MELCSDYTHPENALTAFLQWVYDECEFKHWYCGHYHHPIDVEPNFHVLYKDLIPLGNSVHADGTASEERRREMIDQIIALFQNDAALEMSTDQ